MLNFITDVCYFLQEEIQIVLTRQRLNEVVVLCQHGKRHWRETGKIDFVGATKRRLILGWMQGQELMMTCQIQQDAAVVVRRQISLPTDCFWWRKVGTIQRADLSSFLKKFCPTLFSKPKIPSTKEQRSDSVNVIWGPTASRNICNLSLNW